MGCNADAKRQPLKVVHSTALGAGTYRVLDTLEPVPTGGVVTGTLQWFVLRSQVSRAGWWVLASTVGFLVGGALGREDILRVFLFFITLWAVAGAIIGIAPVWLLRQPAKEA